MTHQPEHEKPSQGATTDWIKVHAKLITFAIGAVLTAAVQIWGTENKWVLLGTLVATGLGVYQVPNKQAKKEPPAMG